MSKAIDDVTAERARQVEKEGWTPEHDDDHVGGDLSAAGACYALHLTGHNVPRDEKTGVPHWWPWDDDAWKPKGRRRNLVRAAALLIAEIERIDRLDLENGSIER